MDFLQTPLLVHVVVECPLSIFRPYFVCAYNVRYAICSVASILKWIYVQKILVIFNTIHSSSMYLVLSTMCLRRCLYYHLPQVNWQCAFWNKRPKNNLLNNRKMKSRSFWIEFDWNDWIQCNLLTNQDNHKDKVGGEVKLILYQLWDFNLWHPKLAWSHELLENFILIVEPIVFFIYSLIH